jgi:hypothetical protein
VIYKNPTTRKAEASIQVSLYNEEYALMIGFLYSSLYDHALRKLKV